MPSQAFWLGGSDGGVFVRLSATGAGRQRVYAARVYEADGSIWYRGPVVLEPAGSEPVDVARIDQFTAWDGTRLLLKDGRALVAKPAGK